MSKSPSRDERFMRHSIELARRAKAAGNTPVGSLVAIGDEIIAEAEEATPAGPSRFAHAELLAVDWASAALGRKHFPEATLYSTAEPCFLCAYAIREAGIGRVVLGAPAPHIGGVTSNHPLLTVDDVERWGPPPEVVWSELGKECAGLFEKKG